MNADSMILVIKKEYDVVDCYVKKIERGTISLENEKNTIENALQVKGKYSRN